MTIRNGIIRIKTETVGRKRTAVFRERERLPKGSFSNKNRLEKTNQIQTERTAVEYFAVRLGSLENGLRQK